MNRYDQIDPVIKAISAEQVMEYKPVKITERWVSEGLKKELETWDYSKWGLLGPILINAPTGSGKSTFVMRDLADRVKNSKKYVLLLSNRSVLQLQQKHSLSNRPGGVGWSGVSLSGLDLIDNVLVYTYQSVSQFLNDPRSRDYPIGAVVFDEAHFFSSDAVFNAYTEQIFNEILRHCWGCQRIYMSATPDDAKWLIAYEELRLRTYLNRSMDPVQFLDSRRNQNPVIKEYLFPTDYSYVKLNFWSRWADIEQLIKTDETTDKWLIFVGDTETGKELKRSLGKDAEYVDASWKEQNPQRFSDLARREFFETRILVSTCALDNGINFKDPLLKHVVIESVDPIQIKQMLGRKRVEEGETVQVHILQKTRTEVDKIRKNLRDLYNLLQEFRVSPYYAIKNRWENLSESQRHMIAPTPNGFLVSGYASFQLDRMIKRLERLSDRMAWEGDGAFVKEICEWFGPTLPAEVTVGENIIEKVRPAIEEIFEKYMGLSPLADDAIEMLEQELKDAAKVLGSDGPKFREGESRTNANIKEAARFFKLPYTSKKRNNHWYLQSTDSAQGDAESTTAR